MANFFWKATPSAIFLAHDDCFFFFCFLHFKLLPRWKRKYWSLFCVYRVSCRAVKVPRKSTILGVFHKIGNGRKSNHHKLWALKTNLCLVIGGICEQSFMTPGQTGREIACPKSAFSMFAIAPPLGQWMSDSRLLEWPSTSVPNFSTFDQTVLWAAIDFNGRINNRLIIRGKDRNTVGAAHLRCLAPSWWRRSKREFVGTK